ncbi:MAG: HIT domain-containing protein, partial [Bacteroidota bacterium]
REVHKIWDLSEEEYLGLMQFSKKVAHAVEAAISCERVGMTVIGLEVPHVHVHLIPLKSMANATFQHKVKLDTDQFEDIAKKIQMELK